MLLKFFTLFLTKVVAIKSDNYGFMTNYVNNFAKNDKLKDRDHFFGIRILNKYVIEFQLSS